jgi:hypothetical protein
MEKKREHEGTKKSEAGDSRKGNERMSMQGEGGELKAHGG